MKRYSFGILILVLTAALAPAQDAATQQQLEKLAGQIQDVQGLLDQQDKRITALEKQISELSDKVNTPVVNDYASRDDLKKLADQVQEIDQKRKDDSEMIARQMEQLAKAAAAPPPPARHVAANANPPGNPESATGNTPQKGYYYEIKPGDTLGLIAKAYRDQGVKVTKAQIIAANPKLNPNLLIVGRKIFIPDASAK